MTADRPQITQEFALEKSKHFCILPWLHYYFVPNGDILPCCVADIETPFGNLKDVSVEEVPHLEAFKEMRSNCLKDLPTRSCHECYEVESTGSNSQRQKFNTMFRDLIEPLTRSSYNGEFPAFELKYLDLRFSNICNFKCRGCDPTFSSSWAPDFEKLHGRKLHPEALLTLENVRPGFWSEFEGQLQGVRSAYFAGGEPLIMPEHYQSLRKMIELGHTNVDLAYNTNLSTLHYKEKALLPLWEKFRFISFGVSIDDFGTRGEYFRKGMDWEKTLLNMEKVADSLKDSSQFYINMTISVFNIFYIPEIIREFFSRSQTRCFINFNYLLGPPYYRMQILGPKAKATVTLKLTQFLEEINELDSQIKKWLHPSLKNLIKFLNAENLQQHQQDFKTITSRLDEIRDEDFAKTYPELNELMELDD